MLNDPRARRISRRRTSAQIDGFAHVTRSHATLRGNVAFRQHAAPQ
jgi:hypothetical protein